MRGEGKTGVKMNRKFVEFPVRMIRKETKGSQGKRMRKRDNTVNL